MNEQNNANEGINEYLYFIFLFSFQWGLTVHWRVWKHAHFINFQFSKSCSNRWIWHYMDVSNSLFSQILAHFLMFFLPIQFNRSVELLYSSRIYMMYSGFSLVSLIRGEHVQIHEKKKNERHFEGKRKISELAAKLQSYNNAHHGG